RELGDLPRAEQQREGAEDDDPLRCADDGERQGGEMQHELLSPSGPGRPGSAILLPGDPHPSAGAPDPAILGQRSVRSLAAAGDSAPGPRPSSPRSSRARLSTRVAVRASKAPGSRSGLATVPEDFVPTRAPAPTRSPAARR